MENEQKTAELWPHYYKQFSHGSAYIYYSSKIRFQYIWASDNKSVHSTKICFDALNYLTTIDDDETLTTHMNDIPEE